MQNCDVWNFEANNNVPDDDKFDSYVDALDSLLRRTQNYAKKVIFTFQNNFQIYFCIAALLNSILKACAKCGDDFGRQPEKSGNHAFSTIEKTFRL